MNTYKLLIADDEPLIRRGISSLDWEKIGITVCAVANNGKEAIDLASLHIPDLVLADIRMPIVNGLDMAERVLAQNKKCKIIFLSGYEDFAYAKRALHMGAFDYILKPITYFAFSKTINHAIERMAVRKRQYTTIAIRNGIQRIDMQELVYVEVRDHELIYYTTGESYTARGSMKDAEEVLKNFSFFRCNKCYLINLAYVERVQNNDVFLGKYVVAVSRARRKQLMDAINDYLNEVSK